MIVRQVSNENEFQIWKLTNKLERLLKGSHERISDSVRGHLSAHFTLFDIKRIRRAKLKSGRVKNPKRATKTGAMVLKLATTASVAHRYVSSFTFLFTVHRLQNRSLSIFTESDDKTVIESHYFKILK